jgi:hypothetical protein
VLEGFSVGLWQIRGFGRGGAVSGGEVRGGVWGCVLGKMAVLVCAGLTGEGVLVIMDVMSDNDNKVIS